jgi:hypothetical protein
MDDESEDVSSGGVAGKQSAYVAALPLHLGAFQFVSGWKVLYSATVSPPHSRVLILSLKYS